MLYIYIYIYIQVGANKTCPHPFTSFGQGQVMYDWDLVVFAIPIVRHGKMGQIHLTRNPINPFKNDMF